jgi:hypothetical protein
MDDFMMQLSNEVNDVLNKVFGDAPSNFNCKCSVPSNPALRTRRVPPTECVFTPVRILKSGNATIVFWKDGTKTVVKCGADETPDDYDAFTAALAIKIFGNNSRLKKVIKNKTVIQQTKKGKE